MAYVHVPAPGDGKQQSDAPVSGDSERGDL
nr:MAG TPA: hypothetical protein [Caudoviricetes sp.]